MLIAECRRHGALFSALAASFVIVIGFLSTTVFAGEGRSRSPQTIAEAFANPVLAVVSTRRQRITVYNANGSALRSRISSGQSGMDTPSGVFAILQKNIDHVSNVYEGADMPFMQRLTWSGVALHAGALPGYPASHGCVRLPYGFAGDLFKQTRLGMRVVISPDDFAPIPISHPKLPQPAPPEVVSLTSSPLQTGSVQPVVNRPFQADVSRWPARHSEMARLLGTAVAKADELATATERANDRKSIFDAAQARRLAAKKVLLATSRSKRAAAQDLSEALNDLAVAKRARPVSRETAAKANALAASVRADALVSSANQKLTEADNARAAAIRALSSVAPNAPNFVELRNTLDRHALDAARANRDARVARLAKREANNELARRERALFVASIPTSTSRQDAAYKKALSAAADADLKYRDADIAMTSAVEQASAALAEHQVAQSQLAASLAAEQLATQRTQPISIFVSLKSQRLFVRQGHQAIFDMPVEIEQPQRPIGTFVFTAVDFESDANRLRWTAVAVGRSQTRSKTDSRAHLSIAAPPTDSAGAMTALDRISISSTVTSHLAGFVWPGSSLIVSDEDVSPETATATDFIVVLSKEPSGALKPSQRQLDNQRRKWRQRRRY